MSKVHGAARREVLGRFGASEAETTELLEYNRNDFDVEGAKDRRFPLEDEAFVEAWREYAGEPAFPALARRLPQLKFPIEEGISETDAYRAAVRRGAEVERSDGLALERPETVRLQIQPTAAGRIPVLIAPHRADFVALLRALTMRNEPRPVPASQGAVMGAGFNNWDRIARLRDEFEKGSRGGDWARRFRAIIPQKELYQDRFVLVSGGPYSDVAAEDLGLGEKEWAELSLLIRIHHECTHYFTRRVFGSMRNRLIDELIADYMGLRGATGKFSAEWFLRFMGLEKFPSFRESGRMTNYRGDPPLSKGAFLVLQRLLVSAAAHLELFDKRVGDARGVESQARLLVRLAEYTIEELAKEGWSAS